jgi:hypothetical protein
MSSTLVESVRLVTAQSDLPLGPGLTASLTRLARAWPEVATASRVVWVRDLDPAAFAGVTPDDHAAASAMGGAIKFVVVSARIDGQWAEEHAGPAVLPRTEPLAAVTGASQGLLVEAPAGDWQVSPHWLCRLTFPGILPAATAVSAAAQAAGLDVLGVVNHDTRESRWLCAGPHAEHAITQIRATLARRHRIALVAIPHLTT